MKPRHTLTLLAVAMALGACATLQPDRPAERNAELRLERGLASLDDGRYSAAFDDLVWVYTHCPGHERSAQALTALAALELDPRNRAARPDVATELLGRIIGDAGTPRWARPLAETTFLTALALGAPRPDRPTPMAGDTAMSDTAMSGTAQETTAAAEAASVADSADDASVAVAARGGGEPVPELIEVPGVTPELAYACGGVIETEGWVAPALPTLPGPSMAALLAGAEADRERAAVRADSLRARLAAVEAQLAASREELERIRQTLKP